MSNQLISAALQAFVNAAEKVGRMTREQAQNIFAAMAVDAALTPALRRITAELATEFEEPDIFTGQEWVKLEKAIFALPGMTREHESNFIAEYDDFPPTSSSTVNMKFMSDHGVTDAANGKCFIKYLQDHDFHPVYDPVYTRCMTVTVDALKFILGKS